MKTLKRYTAIFCLSLAELPASGLGQVQAQAYAVAPAVLLTDTLKLKELQVTDKRGNGFGVGHLRQVEGSSIYAGKKSEVVQVESLPANLATNNGRQVFAKVTGINVVENDGAGLQLSIGGRGLNPNRISNFNTRQNGYDISADALGYPESYYTPPMEAVERIEVVRGAASLQYGTQFGGLVNFRFRQAPKNRAFELISRQTIGSYGFFNSFNSIGFRKKASSGYGFIQHKQGDGWRPNSAFRLNCAHLSLSRDFGEKLNVTAEYTFMNYLAKQPGGLTDQQFVADPSISLRNRNWFQVNWNLAAITADYTVTDRTKLNTRFFGLVAGRDALGFLGAINRQDPMAERDLLSDSYFNFCNETRLISRYDLFSNSSIVLLGVRYYQGLTARRQGAASAASDADFSFLNPSKLEGSDYKFPSRNTALFVENVFQLTHKWSVTPGVRFEYISTRADGYYRLLERNLAKEVILDQTVFEEKQNGRSFVLGGVGTAYKFSSAAELYANCSQNYRGINFNDIRVLNPNSKVDPGLSDETGFTADIGLRGEKVPFIIYEVSLFYLGYNNRIGSVYRVDSVTYNTYRYRTNVSRSRTFGFELFTEVNLWKMFRPDSRNDLSAFLNISGTDAEYVSSDESAFEGKKVEFVAPWILRTGFTFRRGSFQAGLQHSYTGDQFTDATNAMLTANAVNGTIPAYSLADFTISYSYMNYSVAGSINNLFDSRYFTRRADGYPGPGILPGDPRSYFITVSVKL